MKKSSTAKPSPAEIRKMRAAVKSIIIRGEVLLAYIEKYGFSAAGPTKEQSKTLNLLAARAVRINLELLNRASAEPEMITQ